MALAHGTATAPGWVRVLEACETWKKAPWEMARYPGALVWWLRWSVLYEERIRAEREAEKKAERKR